MKTLYHSFEEFKNQLTSYTFARNSTIYICIPHLNDIHFSDPVWLTFFHSLFNTSGIQVHFLWNEAFWLRGQYPKIVQLFQLRQHQIKHYLIPDTYQSKAFFFISSPDLAIQKKGITLFEFSVLLQPEEELGLIYQYAKDLQHECESAPPFSPLGL